MRCGGSKVSAPVVRLYLLPLGPLLGIVAGFSGSVFLPCRDSVFKVPVAGGCPLLTLPS